MANFDTLTETFTLGLSDQLITRKQGELTDKKVAASTVKAALADDAATVKAKYESNPDTNAFTDDEKAKLDGIATGAESNVQSNWSETNSASDAFILNKPTIPTSTTNLPEGTNLYYTEARVSANTNVAANTTKLATIASGAEVNVNADWNAVSGDAQILNKPTIPTSTTNLPEGTNLYYTEARVAANSTVSANTAKLATIASGAEVNVNADWNAVSGDAQILNKPTIPTSTTNLDEGTNLYYTEARVTANTTVAANTSKLATIATGAEVNVQSNWNETNSASDAFILNKPTIPTTTTQISEGTRLYYTEARVAANSTVSANTTKLATIATGAEVNVQSNWNEADSASDAFILNKPTFATVATTGDYGDLLNSPSSTTDIPEGTNLYYTEARVSANTSVSANTAKLATIATGAEVNVNADWNAASGDAQILNKPTIPTTTTQITEGTRLYYTEARVTANSTVSANTTKLATIATGAEVNVQSNWNETNSASDAFILNKPTIPTSTTSLAEGTNLYYTDARVTANTTVAANTSKLATIATGAEVNVQSNWNEANSASDAFILNKPTIPTSTTNLAEGTNLYYTEARVTANTTVAANTSKLATIATGAEVNVQSNWNETNSASDAFILNKPTIPTTTTQITEGTRLYYTEARVTANTTVAANTAKLATIATGAEVNVNADWNAVSGDAQILNKPTIPTTTTQIAEGTNLYFTNARSDSSDSGQYAIAQTCELYVGAAATATGVDPERTADLEGVGFVGIAPYKGNKVALYDPIDQRWYLRTVSAVGLNLSGLAANTNFDLYLGWVGGALSFTTSDWLTSGAGTSTRRTTFDEFIDGIPTIAGNPFYRFIGTFRTASTGTTSDSAQNRLVSNVVHKRWKPFSISNDPTDYTYASTTIREFGNGTTQRVNIAASERTAIIVNSALFCASSGSLPVNGGSGGIGVNSIAGRSGQTSSAIYQSSAQRVLSAHSGIIPAGYNYLAMLEQGFDGNGTTTDDIQMRQSTLNGAVYL